MLGFLFICILCLFLIGAPILLHWNGNDTRLCLRKFPIGSGTTENVCGS